MGGARAVQQPAVHSQYHRSRYSAQSSYFLVYCGGGGRWLRAPPPPPPPGPTTTTTTTTTTSQHQYAPVRTGSQCVGGRAY